MKINSLILGLVVVLCTATARAAAPVIPAVIPQPQSLTLHDGQFQISRDTVIIAARDARETGRYLGEQLARPTGFPLPIDTRSHPGKTTITLTTKDANPKLGEEGYELSVTPDRVEIHARTEAGLFYGAQTFLQLLPVEIFSTNRVTDIAWTAQACEIEDVPRFKWRGWMLDVARHFSTKQEVMRLLDAMAMQKLNTFHWHLTDDQAWRIEIKKYPLLTTVGAWRTNIGFNLDPKASTAYGPDGRYGGFYTQNDIREVVAYAAARHITIVPEIETPGHATAALMAYPQYSCTGGPFTTDLPGGIFNGIYCVGNEATYTFIDDILSEIFVLFPGKYIHVGGDEVTTDNWKNCPKCQAVMTAQGLKKEGDLESYFIRRLEKFINSRGKTLIGWSEIREGGLAQNAAIMDWVGGATEAATAGHDVVMSPTADCYLDYYQSTNQAKEPHAIGGYLPLGRVYAYEPIPTNLPPVFYPHILGAQCNEWTEYMPNLKHVEYMAYPRLCALAEVNWSLKESRNWEDFVRRMTIHLHRLDLMGVNYRKSLAKDG